MFQWMIRRCIGLMGRVYVFLDKFLTHETGEILGLSIDDDFQNMSRRELCQYIEIKLGWEKDDFWNLESTQKIRLCCQVARDNKFKGEKK
tara:strand:- start:1806 stop:2075 length:270 start_codon:yes stop_codon:yes gene_type:complete